MNYGSMDKEDEASPPPNHKSCALDNTQAGESLSSSEGTFSSQNASGFLKSRLLIVALLLTVLALAGLALTQLSKIATIKINPLFTNEKSDMLGAAMVESTGMVPPGEVESTTAVATVAGCTDATPISLGQEVRARNARFADNYVEYDCFECCHQVFLFEVWFSVSVPAEQDSPTHTLKATTKGENSIDRVVAVVGGECDSLKCVPYAGNPSPTSFSDMANGATWCASPGQTYYIIVGVDITDYDRFTDESDFSLTVESVESPCSSPENDICSNAETVNVGEYVFDNIGATDDSITNCKGKDEITTLSSGIWFSFTPKSSGNFEASTCAPGTTVLYPDVYVFSGDCAAGPASLKCLGYNSKTEDNDKFYEACNGDEMFGSPAAVDWCAEAGKTYYIALGSRYAAPGQFGLSIKNLGPCKEDKGVKCKKATEIELSEVNVEKGIIMGSTTGYTADMTIRQLPCGRSVHETRVSWRKVVASIDSIMMMASTCEETDFDTYIEVYKGACSPRSARLCVTYGDYDHFSNAYSDAVYDKCDSGTTVSWCAEAGATYFLAVGGSDDDEYGDYQLDVWTTNTPCPLNTDCANALTVKVNDVVDSHNMVSPRSTVACNSGIHNYMTWYTLEAKNDGFYSVTTCCEECDTDIPTEIWILEGDCDSLTCRDFFIVPVGDSLCGEVHWCAKANQQYTIAIGGTKKGNFRFKVKDDGPCGPPPNEQCVDAISIEVDSPTIGYKFGVIPRKQSYVTLDWFSKGMPSLRTDMAASVWYTVTSPTMQYMLVSVCNPDTDFDAAVDMFGGDCSGLFEIPNLIEGTHLALPDGCPESSFKVYCVNPKYEYKIAIKGSVFPGEGNFELVTSFMGDKFDLNVPWCLGGEPGGGR